MKAGSIKQLNSETRRENIAAKPRGLFVFAVQ
jgi:hypothetical protein